MTRNTASGQSLSAQQARFARAPAVDIQRSTFDRSFNHKTTFDEGQLIPFLVDEILPGDTVQLNTRIVCRLSTPKFPMMSMLWITTHFFFVPYRILFLQWKALQGEQLDPDTDIGSIVMPTMPAPAGGWDELSLGDYFGLPIDIDPLEVNTMPFRAYNKIYNDWYRDEDITDHAVVNTGLGPDQDGWYLLRYRAKAHDYFTSARPWPVKGGVESTFSIGTSAPVVKTTVGEPAFESASHGPSFLELDTLNANVQWETTPTASGAERAKWSTITGLEADLTSAIEPSIATLRLAITMQQALELDARSGTRYTEALRARWKVTSPDFRLQRPEYIGGGRQPIVVTQVPRTDNSPGTMGAFGYSAGGGHNASYTATEHGVLMGIVSVTGDNEYQEGLHKMWKRSTRFDFYEPVFANLGEQPILKGELFSTAVPATDAETWGYQERWAEYRYKPSMITGMFRSQSSLPLDAWHTAEELGSLPGLADEFILTSSDSPNVERVVVTSSDPHFIFDSATTYRHTRAMPVYSVPGLTRL